NRRRGNLDATRPVYYPYCRAAVAARHTHVYHRNASPQDDLHLRPPGQAGAAHHPAAPGAPLPDADPGLLAEGAAAAALPELAAGSLRQLPGPSGLPA